MFKPNEFQCKHFSVQFLGNVLLFCVMFGKLVGCYALIDMGVTSMVDFCK